MASTTKSGLKREPENHVDPKMRFVVDFTRLIADIDRLMVDLASPRDANGEHVRPNGHSPDVTLNTTISALREHAQSLVKSSAHPDSLFDGLPISCMELDQAARIIRTNTDCAQMLNGSGVPLNGTSFFNFLTGQDAKRLRQHLAHAAKTDKAAVLSLSITHKGKNIPIRLRTRRIQGDRRYIAFIEVPDQPSRPPARAGTALESSHRLIQLARDLNAAPNLSAATSVIGRYCAKAFRSTTGMIFLPKDGELRPASHWGFKNVSPAEFIEKAYKTKLATRALRSVAPTFFRIPHRSTAKGAQPRGQWPRVVAFVPLRAERKDPVGVLAVGLPDLDFETSGEALAQLAPIVADAIVRARVYDEAIAGRMRAENAIHNQDEFFSTLSHELKSPMMPILGWAVALSSGTLPAEKQSIALQAIVRNVRTLNYLIEDLFDVARISSGKLRLRPSKIRIQDVAREALSTIQQTVENKKLRISTDISEGIPAFMADARRLQQVLTNLLNNAVKFTPDGGSVALQIRKRGTLVECVVSDTGKGIDRKFLPFVFNRFRQEDRASKMRAAGLGIGLAIVREIVELHGGSVDATSDGVGKGARFIIRLPMRKKLLSEELPSPKREGISLHAR